MDFILEVSWLIIVNSKINVDKLIPLCLGGFFVFVCGSVCIHYFHLARPCTRPVLLMSANQLNRNVPSVISITQSRNGSILHQILHQICCIKQRNVDKGANLLLKIGCFSCARPVIDNNFRHNIVKVGFGSTRLSPRRSRALIML